MMYVDDHLVLDLISLVAATVCDGDGPHDGMHSLLLLLEVANKKHTLLVDYPDAPARDAALRAIGAMVQAEQAAADAPLTLDLDTEEGWRYGE